jgi:hypothetical protein
MSIEAITYAKTLKGMKPGERLTLFIIAENTFNDTGKCKIGNAELAYQTGSGLRSVVRYIQALAAGGFIKISKQPRATGGSSFAHMELVGFVEWLAGIRNPKVPTVAFSAPEAKPESAKSVTRKCQQVALSNKTVLQSVQDADQPKNAPTFREGASDWLIPSVGTDVIPGAVEALTTKRHPTAGIESGKRLPFTADVLFKIGQMCVPREALIAEFYERTKRMRVRDPSAYLLRMAREQRAKLDGVSVETVEAMYSHDRERRAEAMAAEVDPEPDLKAKAAAARTRNGAALVAALRKRVHA